jgi:hypothetical protein
VTLENINPSLPRPTHIPAPQKSPVVVPVTMRGQLVPRNEGVIVSISREAMRLRGSR